MSIGPQVKKASEPLRGVERLEWARVALEEAVGRMVRCPDDSAYRVAVVARYRELDEIRHAVIIQVEAKQRPDEPPIEALACFNCKRGVAMPMQHFTGTRWMCSPATAHAP